MIAMVISYGDPMHTKFAASHYNDATWPSWQLSYPTLGDKNEYGLPYKAFKSIFMT